MKRVFSVLISIGILYWLLSNVDVKQTLQLLQSCDLAYIGYALVFVIPIYFLGALRLQLLSPVQHQVPVKDSTILIMLASTLNLILPAKLGDISKSYFMTKRYDIKPSMSLAIVFMEKAGDMQALCTCSVIGLLIAGKTDGPFFTIILSLSVISVCGFIICVSKSLSHFCFETGQKLLPQVFMEKIKPLFKAWVSIQMDIKQHPGQYLNGFIVSCVLGVLHFFQMWLLLKSLGTSIPFSLHMGLTALGILAGLAPFTLSGIGTRDAILVVLYTPYIGAAAATAYAFLTTLRVMFMALPGLAFISTYLSESKQIKASLNT